MSTDQPERLFTVELNESEVIACINHHAAMIRKITRVVGKEALKIRGQKERSILIDTAESMIKEHSRRGNELHKLIKP
jgi:ribulose 1,5-bisphosphate synthetase/thiazole synthase